MMVQAWRWSPYALAGTFLLVQFWSGYLTGWVQRDLHEGGENGLPEYCVRVLVTYSSGIKWVGYLMGILHYVIYFMIIFNML